MTREQSGVEGPEKPGARDAGFSLVEVLVGLGLFGLLGTVLLGFALSTSKVTEDVRLLSQVNEESRLAMERLTRELRQASTVQAAELSPDGARVIAVTFWTDFNGNGTQDLNAADPEVLTYRWNPDKQELTLTANDASGTAHTLPVLAANVTDFSVDLRSSLWEHDKNRDGVTTWRELDASSPVGNANHKPDGDELKLIDLVGVSLTVLDGTHDQSYRTQVDLRNNQS
jgi:prepilin-type N-terminal cleavage/methylation domain-containing protein